MARSLVDERFSVVDVETSGRPPTRHRVLQIGLVTIDGNGTVLDRWATLVGPGLAIWRSVGPSDVHGIRRRDLVLAPRPRRAFGELARRLAGTRVVAHNAPFDLAFLRAEAARAGIDLPLDRPLCTLQLSRSLDPGRQLSHRLVDACARRGIDLVNAHDALADAEATAALFPHLLHDHGITSTEQLAALPTAR
ncbi:MAG: exonuclease domain-containing protein [Ilumatobacteraceae bacterium]